jgi:hypothetical protein
MLHRGWAVLVGTRYHIAWRAGGKIEGQDRCDEKASHHRIGHWPPKHFSRNRNQPDRTAAAAVNRMGRSLYAAASTIPCQRSMPALSFV